MPYQNLIVPRSNPEYDTYFNHVNCHTLAFCKCAAATPSITSVINFITPNMLVYVTWLTQSQKGNVKALAIFICVNFFPKK
jgi:hypothetical protein